MIKILQGDSRELLSTLDANSVNCVITSPPYFGLRDYGIAEQIGLEETPEAYIDSLLAVFEEIWRVLKKDGTVWLNIGDSYASDTKGSGGNSTKSKKQLSNTGCRFKTRKFNHGVKSKDLLGIPWMIAFSLREQGWYLRQDIIWHKPNAMCESVQDRCTKTHEYLFLLSKSERYYFDQNAIKEQTKNNTLRQKRSIWTIPVQSFHGAHFATFPKELVSYCVLAGCPETGTVLDPFFGSGTTGAVCRELNRNCIGIELNPEYAKVAEIRSSGFETRSEIMSSKIKYEDTDLW